MVAILDTGVNDEADSTNGYPDTNRLRGKWVGGGSFFAGQPELNTGLDESVNPRHTGDPEATYHGTHVAGTAIGSGGPNGMLNGAEPGFNAGLAPDARLVDCKVLSDAGAGFGVGRRARLAHPHTSSTPGASPARTRSTVASTSPTSRSAAPDASDGTDANCAAVNAAHKAGIVVCVASGNDGNTGYMPSPAAADFALTVGAFTDGNTIDRLDDYVADYSNEGPRLADGDTDHLDEMKPNVMGSGTGINSALGDPTTNGDRYHHINGTSMATPTIAGVAALVRSTNPTLSSDQVRLLLMDTADHRTRPRPATAERGGSVPHRSELSSFVGMGPDGRIRRGQEALNPATTQVVRIQAIPQRGPDGVQIEWTSQREVQLQRYELDRASDLGGAPGRGPRSTSRRWPRRARRFTAYPIGTTYSYTDLDGSLDPAAYYWYRVRWVDLAAASHSEPAIRTRIMDSPVIARIKYSWTHNYSDGDLYVRFGTGTSTSGPAWFRQGLGAQAADSVVTRSGVSHTGTLQHYFHVDLTADDMVGAYLATDRRREPLVPERQRGRIREHQGLGERLLDDGVRRPEPDDVHLAEPADPDRREAGDGVLDSTRSGDGAQITIRCSRRSARGPWVEGLTVTFFVSASDPDNGQTVTHSAVGLPAGATFDSGTRQFSWTPSYSQAGGYRCDSGCSTTPSRPPPPTARTSHSPSPSATPATTRRLCSIRSRIAPA